MSTGAEARARTTYEVRTVGFIRSPLKRREDAPRQGFLGAPEAWIELDERYLDALLGVEPGSQLEVLTWLHLSDRDVLRVTPGHDPEQRERGVFSTRAPVRPNPIGLHPVTVLEVSGPRLRVAPLEAVDGTPVVDLKARLERRDSDAAETPGKAAPMAFQDFYPEDVAHCFGCGRLNERGHRLRSFWDGEETVARFTPEPWHTAIPGYVYGGLIASLVDCHGTGTAAAVGARTAGYRLGPDPLPAGTAAPRYVTASLEVRYLRPTPLGPELTVRGVVEDAGEEKGSRKVVTRVTIEVEGEVTAEGRVVAVRMPDTMLRERSGPEKA